MAILLERSLAYASMQLRDSSAQYICAYVRGDGRLIYGAGASTWQAIVDATAGENAGEARDEANRIADLCRFPQWRFEGDGDMRCQVWPIVNEACTEMAAFLFKL